MLKLNETQIPQNYSVALYNNKGFDLMSSHTDKIVDVLFTGVTTCLADIKNRDIPVAFVFDENNGDFIAGAVVEYVPNEDDASKPGNWNYFWTWESEDVPGNSRLVRVADVNLTEYFRTYSHSKYDMDFVSVAALNDLLRVILAQIKKWLDENASETEEVGVEMDGVFQARVAIEDGTKVMSLEADGEIKKLIKDDSAIEV